MNLVGANDVQRIQRTMKSAEHSEEFKLRSTCDPKPTSRDCAFAFGSVVFPLLFISCIHKIMKTRHTRIRKKRGRPATGQDPVVPVRLPPEIIKKIELWGAKQPEPARSRSETIRSLVEMALAKAETARSGRVKSAQLAGQTIDVITDPAAAPEERAKRKRRLLKGPKEFRDLRGDAPNSPTRKN